MDAAAILALIEKGLILIPILIQAGEEIAPLVQRLIDVARGAQDGSITDDQLNALEADIDRRLADFNQDMAK
jgi:hypothetical protein